MVIWKIFGTSMFSGQIKTQSFRLLHWVAQYQDFPSLKRYENLGFGAFESGQGRDIIAAGMHIAHVHLCSVQKCRCLPCNMVRDVIVLLLNHALGVRAELFRERGKRAFRGEEEGGRGLHYGKTRRPGPLFHSSGESWKTPCTSNEWFYVTFQRGADSIFWISGKHTMFGW